MTLEKWKVLKSRVDINFYIVVNNEMLFWVEMRKWYRDDVTKGQLRLSSPQFSDGLSVQLAVDRARRAYTTILWIWKHRSFKMTWDAVRLEESALMIMEIGLRRTRLCRARLGEMVLSTELGSGNQRWRCHLAHSKGTFLFDLSASTLLTLSLSWQPHQHAMSSMLLSATA